MRGTQHNIKVGDTLSVYRKDEFIGKVHPAVNFISVFFQAVFILINQAAAEENPQASQTTTQKVSDSTRIKRLEAIDVALKQNQGAQVFLEPSPAPVTNKALKNETLGQAAQTKVSLLGIPKPKKNTLGSILQFMGLAIISVLLGIFFRYKVAARTKNMAQEIRGLKSQLGKKDNLLEQVEIIRKTIEITAIEKEKEYAQLKLELEEKSRLFEQEASLRSEEEKALQELEREHAQLKETSESLKDVLIKRGIASQLTLPQGKGELWILGKSQERRSSPRLSLSKDFHNTVILKIELSGSLKQIKSFAEDISLGGLCFKTKSELDEKNPLYLRLFFYGGKVSNFRTQAMIAGRRAQDSKNYYNVAFGGLSEKVESELRHYVETNVTRG